MTTTTQTTHTEHLELCRGSLSIAREVGHDMARNHFKLGKKLSQLRHDIDSDEFEASRGCLYCAPGTVLDGDCGHTNGGDPRYHDIARLKVEMQRQSQDMDTITAAMERMVSTSNRMRLDIQRALEREESAQR